MSSFQFRIAAALLTILCSNPLLGQNLIGPGALPDAPVPAGQAAPAAEAQGTAQVAGVVLDAQSSAVPGADVALAAAGRLGERTASSAADGSFSFTGLPSGEYRLIVTAPGFDVFTSATFQVRTGESATAPRVALTTATSTTTSVNVFATPDQVAAAQVHEEEQQRVFAVFPNFYTSYIWNAQPLPAGQKFKLALRALVDPVQFLTVAGTAGAEQIGNTYPGYGSGPQGYGKRYAAGLADATTSRLVGSAILPSLFHQDPRYFYQGTGGGRSRAWHAVNSTFVTRGDNGKDQPNFAHLLGSLTAAAVANAYHPASSRGFSVTFETFGITLAGNVAGDLFREFILRGLVPSVPSFANGKHQPSPSH